MTKVTLTSEQLSRILDQLGDRFSTQLGQSWTAVAGRLPGNRFEDKISIWNGQDTFVLDCDLTTCHLSKLIFEKKSGWGMQFIWGCAQQVPDASRFATADIGDVVIGDALPEDGINLPQDSSQMEVGVNHAPVIHQLKGPVGLGILPSGDQCFSVANTIPFFWDASDVENDPLSCTVNVFEANNGNHAASVAVTQVADESMVAHMPAKSLKPRTDYCWDLSCNDGKAPTVVAGSNACFTTSEKGLIGLWQFDGPSGANGTTVVDKSGNGVNGVLLGNSPSPQWLVDSVSGGKMLCLGGNGAHVKITPPDTWKEFDNLSFRTRFLVDPNNNPDTFLIHWSNEVKHGLLLRLQEKFKKTIFGLCDQLTPCENAATWWATTDVPLAPNQLHDLVGVINMGSANLYIDQKKVGEKVAEQPTKAVLGGVLVFGKLYGSPQLLYSFVGCFDEIAIYNINVFETCK